MPTDSSYSGSYSANAAALDASSDQAHVRSFSSVFDEELRHLNFPAGPIPPPNWPSGNSYDPPANESERIQALNRNILSAKRPLTALCLSGGGIRSATFSLGVLQALARKEQLAKFHYLSTVSGGGYIGGWLSAWLRRSPQTGAVMQQLNSENVDAPPVTYLRAYSSYLAPRRGWSADTWTLIALYIRNLILN